MPTDFLMTYGALVLFGVAMFALGYGARRWGEPKPQLVTRPADLRVVTGMPEVAARLRRSTTTSILARIRDDLGAIRERVTRLTEEHDIPRLLRVELCGIEVQLRSVCRAAGVPMPAVRLVPVPEFDDEPTDAGGKPGGAS